MSADGKPDGPQHNGHVSNGHDTNGHWLSSSRSPVPSFLSSFPSISSSLILTSLLFLWLSLDPHRRPRHLRSMVTFGPSTLVNEMAHIFLPLVSIPAIALLCRRLFSSSSPSLSSPTSLVLGASLLSQCLSAASLVALFLRSLRSRGSFRRALLQPAALSDEAVKLLQTPAPKSSGVDTSLPPLLNPVAAGEQGAPVGGRVFRVTRIQEGKGSAEARRRVESVGTLTPFRCVQMFLPHPALTRWADGIRVDYGLTFHVVAGGHSGSHPTHLQHLRLDVYHPPSSPLSRPESASSAVPLFPLVVNVHGGGWITGDKDTASLPLVAQLALSGVVVASINYRLAPRARLPAQVIDVKRAIAFLRQHAAMLHVDPALVFLAGDSAGGHLAAVAALTPGRDDLQPGFEGRDTSVLGVLDLYGIHSFMASKMGEVEEGGFLNFLGAYVMPASHKDRPDLYRDASPVFHVQRALESRDGRGPRVQVPPFFCCHGHWDTLVPVEDSLRFFSLLLELRQREREDGEEKEPLDVCVDVEGGGHAFNLLYNARTYALGDAAALWIARVLMREGRPPAMSSVDPREAREWIRQRSAQLELKSHL